MVPAITGSRFLLALGGLLEAAISAIYFVMFSDGSLTFHAWNGAVVLAGELAMAAAVCTIAGGIGKDINGRSWLLPLNGFALGALGLVQYSFKRFQTSFLSVALLVILMAMSAAVLELLLAQSLRRKGHAAHAWFLLAAGLGSSSLALVFLALGLRWIEVRPGSHLDIFWIGIYFGLSASGKMGVALRPRTPGLTQPGADLPPFGRPRHAH